MFEEKKNTILEKMKEYNRGVRKWVEKINRIISSNNNISNYPIKLEQ